MKPPHFKDATLNCISRLEKQSTNLGIELNYFFFFTETTENDSVSSAASAEASALYKAIVTSILESEAIYLEALSVMLQYMKAMKVTLSTDQPFIPKEDFEVIFHKVPELHDLHLAFHESLKKLVERWDHGG